MSDNVMVPVSRRNNVISTHLIWRYKMGEIARNESLFITSDNLSSHL